MWIIKINGLPLYVNESAPNSKTLIRDTATQFPNKEDAKKYISNHSLSASVIPL